MSFDYQRHGVRTVALEKLEFGRTHDAGVIAPITLHILDQLKMQVGWPIAVQRAGTELCYFISCGNGLAIV